MFDWPFLTLNNLIFGLIRVHFFALWGLFFTIDGNALCNRHFHKARCLNQLNRLNSSLKISLSLRIPPFIDSLRTLFKIVDQLVKNDFLGHWTWLSSSETSLVVFLSGIIGWNVWLIIFVALFEFVKIIFKRTQKQLLLFPIILISSYTCLGIIILNSGHVLDLRQL